MAFEFEVFGKERDVVVLRGDFARGSVGSAGDRSGASAPRRRGRRGLSPGCKRCRAGAGRNSAVERGDELDALQRIEAERVDRCFGRDVREAGARHRQRMLADGGERGGLRGRRRRRGLVRMPAALGEGLELVGEECGAAGVALDLAAGSSWRSCRSGSARRRRAPGRARRGPRRGRRRGPAPGRRCRRARPRARGPGAACRPRRRRTRRRGRLRAAGGFRARWLRCPAGGG